MFSLTLLFGDEAPILRETNFQFLLLATLLPVLGTALVSPVLDSLIGPLGASTATIGWMISVFTAPAIVMIPLAGILADRYDRKAILVPSITLFGLSGVGIAFTTDFRLVLVLRLLQGVGFAGINPIIITILGDLYTSGTEETAQGIRLLTSGLSGGLFPLFAGLLVVFAWQYPFLLYAVAFPIAIGMFLWFDEPTTADSSLSTDGGVGGDGSESYTRALWRLSRQRRVLAMVAARALMIPVFIGFITYNSLIVVRLLGGTPIQAGVLTAVVYFSFALSASQAGRISAAFDSRLYPLLGANVCLGFGFVIVLFAPGIVLATVGTAILGLGFGIVGALYRSIITGLAPVSLRAGLVSLSEAGGRVTATLTPPFIGAVVTIASPVVGFESALQLAGLLIAILGGGGGIICILVASGSAPVSID
ncbi:MFS transporter [Salinibaculum salinum]|uniref:MFS transporter n=1 Tax=Salinibaculum salinum TaxID=3131996 RepID=UPI0030EB6B7E